MTDERLANVSNNARVLFLSMVCHCAAELTDGRIPRALLPILHAQARTRKRDLDELLKAGLVEKLGKVPGSPMSDDYYLPAYLNWNPSREQLETERRRNADRQQAFRERQSAQKRLRAV